MNPFIPMSEMALGSALSMFAKVSGIMMGLVSAMFVVRVTLLLLRLGSGSEYGSVVLDTVSYLIGISVFAPVVRLIFEAIGQLARQIGYSQSIEAHSQIGDFVFKLFGDYPLFKVFGTIGDLILGGLANSIYTILISLLLCIAPIVFFLQLMGGIGFGVKFYFNTLISFALWPVLWNLLGLLGQELWAGFGNSPILAVVFWLVIEFLQVTSPIFCVILFKSLTPEASISKVIKYVC